MGLCIIAQGKNRRACHLFHLGAKGHAEHIGPMQCRHDIGVARAKRDLYEFEPRFNRSYINWLPFSDRSLNARMIEEMF